MQDRYANRQNMHLTVLNLLNKEQFQAVWKNQNPTAFTTYVARFSTLTSALANHIAAQQAATIGYAQAKEREEEELETVAHEYGANLAAWLEENGRDGEAAQIDLSLTAWQRLRDTALIAKARLLHQLLTAAIASDAAALAEYDLTTAEAGILKKETEDFEKIVADPAAAISRRRALTLTLRPKFAEVSDLLGKMDRLVLRFRRSAPGTAFAEAWDAARIIRDLVGSAPDSPPPAPGA